MLEDTRLQVFMAVADEGSFTRAAYLLGISQPAVSQHIAELEKVVGQPLFQRTRGAVRLTPEGERFQFHARRILDGYAALDTVFSVSAAPVVSVLATPFLLSSFLPSLLSRLSGRIPVRFSVRTMPEGIRPNDSELSFYTAPSAGSLDFHSQVLGSVSATCVSYDAAASSESAPVLLWSPYRNYCTTAISDRVMLVSDDPRFLLEQLRVFSGSVALLPALPACPELYFLPVPEELPVFDIRCDIEEEFASTVQGELLKKMIREY